jgi:Mg/Co/Ni transporter MgtE
LQGLLRGLSAQRSAELISRMEPDEGAEVLRDLDDDHRESIFMEMDVSVAKQLRKLVEFDETLAGGIMTSHMLITHEDDTVASALALLVKHKSRDISDGIVVVDARGKLLDHIQIIELIAAKPSAKLSSLMGPPYPTTVNLNTRLDEVIDEFANNRGSSIIVVDEKNKPVGRILADDLVDALASTSDTQGFSQGSGAL